MLLNPRLLPLITRAQALALLLFACACNRYYYRPNAVNDPLFTGGGQAHLGVSADGSRVNQDESGGDLTGYESFFDVQAAVSPVNHLAAMVNYSTYSYHANQPYAGSGNVDAHAHLLEGAIGGYEALGGRVKMVADLFVGYGGGPLRSDVDLHLSRWFVQPGIGMHSKWVDAGFNLRLSVLNYSNFDANGHTNEYLAFHSLADSTTGTTIASKSYVFAEPSFTVRTGYKFAKMQLQVVLATPVSNIYWRYNTAMFTAGVYFTLEDLLKGKAASGR